MPGKNVQRELEYYASKLQLPAWKFILVNGLAWAIPVMIIMIPLDYLLSDEPVSVTIPGLILRIGIWIVGGLLYGWLMRMFHLKKYRTLKQKLDHKKTSV